MTDLVFPSLLDLPVFSVPWRLFTFLFPFDVALFGFLALGVSVLVSAGRPDFLPFF